MNISQSYVSLFFWLGSCQLGLKVFHWERKFCLFLISTVFSILEIYIYLNSVLLVFCFCFCFLFSFSFLGDKHGCLISEIRPWQDLCLKTTIWTSRTLLQRHSENISERGTFFWTLGWSHVDPGVLSQWTMFSQVPMLDPSSRQTSSYEKKKMKKNL